MFYRKIIGMYRRACQVIIYKLSTINNKQY